MSMATTVTNTTIMNTTLTITNTLIPASITSTTSVT